MMALLRIAVLKMSLFDRGATYGSGLQNLKYRNEWKHQDARVLCSPPLCRLSLTHPQLPETVQFTARDSSLLLAQKAAYMTLLVLPSYLHARLRDRMLSSSWSDEPLPRSWLSLIDIRRSFKRGRRRGEEEGEWRGEWKRVVWELLSIGERAAAVAGLVNFLVFLYDGR
jgi:peroxin-2